MRSSGRNRWTTTGIVAVVVFGAGGLAVALGLPWWILVVCLVLVVLSAVGFG
ncbi:MAG: hypothetical protein U0Q07_08040 [Acidimicrobiales bacterium]